MSSISHLTNLFSLKLQSRFSSKAKYPSIFDDNFSQRVQIPPRRRRPLTPSMMSRILNKQLRDLKGLKTRLRTKELRARREFIASERAEKVQLAPPYRGSRLNPDFEVRKDELDENPTIKKWNALRLIVCRRSKIAYEIEKKTEKLERLSRYILAYRKAQKRGVGSFNVELWCVADKKKLGRKWMENSPYFYD
ncbi:hypothetical protein HYALB_00006258 [Hymenoscyphus albidus]|uniref:Uncharacterized protein n=1 Tax=Hymenoscyphus albidus TaxID=595503 RepID=A0A9N9LZ21_9HELO|nr:hypothetical protein HYALB_00006258 [Hymenoscyphus albidus]